MPLPPLYEGMMHVVIDGQPAQRRIAHVEGVGGRTGGLLVPVLDEHERVEYTMDGQVLIIKTGEYTPAWRNYPTRWGKD